MNRLLWHGLLDGLYEVRVVLEALTPTEEQRTGPVLPPYGQVRVELLDMYGVMLKRGYSVYVYSHDFVLSGKNLDSCLETACEWEEAFRRGGERLPTLTTYPTDSLA